MSVRAKFRVTEVAKLIRGTRVTLQPVWDPNPESPNFAFWEATPSGTLTMEIQKEQAAAFFEVGNYYFVDFTPAE